MFVKKSIKLKKSKPKIEISFQILNEKILPKPNIQANKPKIITPIFRVNIFCSSTHAVKGSISDTEELTAAIEIKIKKIEERTSVGCDEHRSNQAIPSSTKDIVLKLGARHRHCFNWMESCKKEGE